MLAFMLFAFQLVVLFFRMMKIFWGRTFSIWSGRFVKHGSGYVDINPALAYISLILLVVFVIYCTYQVYRNYYVSGKRWLSYVYAMAPLTSTTMARFWFRLMSYANYSGFPEIYNDRTPTFVILNSLAGVAFFDDFFGLLYERSPLYGWALIVSILTIVLVLRFLPKKIIAFFAAIVWSVVVFVSMSVAWFMLLLAVADSSPVYRPGISYGLLLVLTTLSGGMFIVYGLSAIIGVMRGWFWRALLPGMLPMLLMWIGGVLLFMNSKLSSGLVISFLEILGLAMLFFYWWWRNFKKIRLGDRGEESSQESG
jgi:hypothetical protein